MLSANSTPAATENPTPAASFFQSPASNTNSPGKFPSVLANFKSSDPKTKSGVAADGSSFDRVNPPVIQKPLREAQSRSSKSAAVPASLAPVQPDPLPSAAGSLPVLADVPVVLSSPLPSATSVSSEPDSAIPGESSAADAISSTPLNAIPEAGISPLSAKYSTGFALNGNARMDGSSSAAPAALDNVQEPPTPALTASATPRDSQSALPQELAASAPDGANSGIATDFPAAQIDASTANQCVGSDTGPGTAPATAPVRMVEKAPPSPTPQNAGAEKSLEPGAAAGVGAIGSWGVILSGTAPFASLGQKYAGQQEQSRQEIAQEIVSRLHSSLGDAAASPVTPPVAGASASATAVAEGKFAAQFSNSSSANGGSNNSVKTAASGAQSAGAGNSGPSDGNSQNLNPNSGASGNAVKGIAAAGTIFNAPPDASHHAMCTNPLPMPPANAGSVGDTSKPVLPSTTTPGPQQSLPAALPASPNDAVQASRLYQRVGGAEMHISLDTDLLGSIDLRAVVHQSGLTATIGVQHADVQALLSSELPGLQHALSQKNLHVEEISILGSAVGGQSNQGGNAQNHNNHSLASQPPLSFGPARVSLESTAAANESAGASDRAGGLSVLV